MVGNKALRNLEKRKSIETHDKKTKTLQEKEKKALREW